MKRIAMLAGVLFLGACGANAPAGVDCIATPTAPACQADAGPDAGPVDAGDVDAGDVDAGPVDAGCGDDLSACPGGICQGGACVAACAIADGGPVDAGSVNPDNACETCQPAVSTSVFSPLADGTSCDADGQHFCLGDTCLLGCDIPNVGVVDAGAAQASNECQTCQPAASATAYSSAPNGTVCTAGGGNVCFGGSCAAGCVIDGAYHATGDNNGSNVCQVCDPILAPTAWTNTAVSCSANGGNFCNGGACTAGCMISGTFYPAGANNGGNVCQVCDPAQNTTDWSHPTVSCSANGGNICFSGACLAGCVIGGSYYTTGTTHVSRCQSCVPSSSSTNWTNAANGTSCGCGPDGQGNPITYDECSNGTCSQCARCGGTGPVCCGTCAGNGCVLVGVPACTP